MEIKIALLAICIAKCLAETHKVPQVYEESEDQIYKESSRVVRDPTQSQLKSTRIYQPPIFNFQNAYQQDKQKHRYAEQQRADIRNIVMKRPSTLNQHNQKSRNNQQDILKFHNLHKDIVNNHEPIESIWTKIVQHPITRRNVRTSRKLTPNSYYEELTKNGAPDILRRQDYNNHIVYVDPSALKAHFKVNPQTEQELSALNALIGQNPNTQLEGLRKLLGENPQIHQNINKDHTPITEHTIDVPNNQDRPNIKIEHDDKVIHQSPHGHHQGGEHNLQDLQAQYDEAAKVHTARALAQAQLEAEAHVKAQNEAIAKAQAEAQREALATIAAHNQRFESSQKLRIAPENHHPRYHENRERIVALPLKGEPDFYVPTPQAGVLIHSIQAENHNEAIFKAREAENVAQNQVEQAIIQAHKDARRTNKLKKISITNSQSITQAHHGQGFGGIVRNNQDFNQEIYPHLQEQHDEDHDLDEHQYAARYAFGYRIKDVKMGNDFGHEEKRDGKNAKGHYHVLLPDGRLQKVEYYADPTGYHAKVTYENIAHH